MRQMSENINSSSASHETTFLYDDIALSMHFSEGERVKFLAKDRKRNDSIRVWLRII